MKLNYEGRKELREKLEQIIMSEVSDGEKIALNEVFSDIKEKLGVEDLYDYLLFESFVDEKTGEIFKVPVWSGEFLRRVDLSNVSFENVAWTTASIMENSAITDDIANDIFNEDCQRIHMVDYSYTNAVINFSKSWEVKALRSELPAIEQCNFAGLDLSTFDINDFAYIDNSDISDTRIRVSKIDLDRLDDMFANTNFSNLDMSHLTLYAPILTYISCIFINTGLNIEFSLDDFFDKKYGWFSDELEDFRNQLKEGYYDGCYLNGKRIDIVVTKREMAGKYEQYKQDLFASVSDAITKRYKK